MDPSDESLDSRFIICVEDISNVWAILKPVSLFTRAPRLWSALCTFDEPFDAFMHSSSFVRPMTMILERVVCVGVGNIHGECKY